MPLTRKQRNNIDELHRQKKLDSVSSISRITGADAESVRSYLRERGYATNFRRRFRNAASLFLLSAVLAGAGASSAMCVSKDDNVP